MSDLIFSKRMELEKEYLEWVKVAGLADCASNVIVFLIGKGLIQDRQDGPVYYLLRRAVGKTTMHYEYWCVDGRFWSDELYPWGCTFDKHDAELYKNDYGGEIIPVKLVEVPHES